jgi:hypothetical protein
VPARPVSENPIPESAGPSASIDRAGRRRVIEIKGNSATMISNPLSAMSAPKVAGENPSSRTCNGSAAVCWK